MSDVTVNRDDLSVLLNIAATAKARGHVSENDSPALDAIRRCQRALVEVSQSGRKEDRTPQRKKEGALVIARCASERWLRGVRYGCGYPATLPHDECLLLVRADDGTDLALKWKNLEPTTKGHSG